MANVLGFEYESPAEFRQRQMDTVTALRVQAGDSINANQAINLNMIQQALLGSPEGIQAENTEKVLTTALSGMQKGPEEDERAFQIRQMKAIREGLLQINPTLALEANDRILAYENEKFEQNRLKAQDDRAADKHKAAMDEAKLGRTPTYFIRDADGDLTAVASLPMETTDEERLAKKRELEQLHGQPVIQGNALMRLQVEGLRDTSRLAKSEGDDAGFELRPKDQMNLRTSITQGANTLFEMNKFIGDFGEAPLSLARGADTMSAGASLMEAVLRFSADATNLITGKTMAEDQRTAGVAVGWIDTAFDKLATPQSLQQMRDLGIDSAKMKGMIASLAYALARTNDTGRLSDQDVEMAASMLIGNGSPETVLANFRRRAQLLMNSIGKNRDLAMGGYIMGDEGRKRFMEFEEEYKALTGSLDDLEELLLNGGLINTNPSRFSKFGSRAGTSGGPTGGITDRGEDSRPVQAPAPIKFKVRAK